MVTIGWILVILLTIYEWILFCRAIFSWVQVFNPRWTPRGAFLLVAEGTYTVTDPPLRFLRKLMKPLRIGNINFDVALLVLFVFVALCIRAVQWLFF